jgi:flagellar biosynthesis/type III secretory pathway ATPase
MNEPVADTVRGILDGHIVLSRELAHRNHYPAIDVLASVSRIMPDISSEEHLDAAGYLKNNLSVYTESQDLINIGAYKRGTNPEIDQAVMLYPDIIRFLRQGIQETTDFEDTISLLTMLKGSSDK